MKIGRDVIRALQDVGHIKVFRDILLEISKGSSFKEVGGTSTTQQILKARITPEMERDISFLLNNVTYAQQKYYQGWLFSKYFTGDCEYIIPDVVRYICCICDPPEENKTRDILDRWAFVGWLYSQMRTDGGKALVKQAVFYDWFWFNPDADKVTFLEPAAGLMFYSLTQYREMTATFLEFLVISSEIYCAKEKIFIVENIKKSFKTLVMTRKFHSFQQLFDFDGVHKVVHDKFNTFNPGTDIIQDKITTHQLNQKQQGETLRTRGQKQLEKAKIQLPGNAQKIQDQASYQKSIIQPIEEPCITTNQTQARKEENKKDHVVSPTNKVTELFLKEPIFENFICAIEPYVGSSKSYDVNFFRVVKLFSGMIESDIINYSLNSIFLCNRGPLSMLFETVSNETDNDRRQIFFDVMGNLRKDHPSIGYRFFAYTICRYCKDFSSSPRSFLNKRFMGSLEAYIDRLIKTLNTKIDLYIEFANKVKNFSGADLNFIVTNDFIVCASQCPSAYALLVPFIFKHIDLGIKSTLELLITTAQYLLPNQIEKLISYIEKGDFSITPQTTSIEDAVAFISRDNMYSFEKANALKLIFAEYDHRGTLQKFIQDNLVNDKEKLNKNIFVNLPISVNTIKCILLAFSSLDAQEILSKLFQRNKDKFTDYLHLLFEDQEHQEHYIKKLLEMSLLNTWTCYNQDLKDAIEKEHKVFTRNKLCTEDENGQPHLKIMKLTI